MEKACETNSERTVKLTKKRTGRPTAYSPEKVKGTHSIRHGECIGSNEETNTIMHDETKRKSRANGRGNSFGNPERMYGDHKRKPSGNS